MKPKREIDEAVVEALKHMADLHGAQIKLHEIDNERICRIHWMIALLAISQILIVAARLLTK